MYCDVIISPLGDSAQIDVCIVIHEPALSTAMQKSNTRKPSQLINSDWHVRVDTRVAALAL